MEPWLGQSNVASNGFHFTTHFICGQIAACVSHIHFHQSAANFHLSLYFHPTLMNHTSKPETVRVLICLQQYKMKNFHKTVNEFALTSNINLSTVS
jgi:hypothetical protein